MIRNELKLIGLLMLACEKHKGDCECPACIVVKLIWANFNNICNPPETK